MDTDELYKLTEEIILHLNSNEFETNLYTYGKRVYREIIRRGDHRLEDHIQKHFEADLKKEYFTAGGLFSVFLAGEIRMESLTPKLAKLLARVEEDFLLEELMNALVKIGTEEVLQEIEPNLHHTEMAFATVTIYKNIKHPLVEEILLPRLEKEEDKGIKTLIASALCYQLSTKAIPMVDKVIEEGYDKSILDLTEDIYPNAVINGVDYPKVDQWKNELLEQDAKWSKFRKNQAVEQAKRNKVGRNDPCPCGSGRKFKKCCGA